MTFPTLTVEELESKSVDGEWYLSKVTPEMLQSVARTMDDHGASLEDVGKLVKHHVHDYGDEDHGLQLYVLRHEAESGAYGVVALVPVDERWYGSLFPDDGPEAVALEDADVEFRLFDVPDHDEVRRLCEDELVTRGQMDATALFRSDPA